MESVSKVFKLGVFHCGCKVGRFGIIVGETGPREIHSNIIQIVYIIAFVR